MASARWWNARPMPDRRVGVPARLLALLEPDERRGLYLALQKIIRHAQGLAE